MKPASLLLIFLLASQVFGQTLKRGEYFFDSDPGKGNGTSLSFAQTASLNQTFSINLSSLAAGVHTFNIRFVDSNGHWSLFSTRTFLIVTTSAAATATTLKKAEYFFDTDPGIGKATALSISASGTENNTFAISLGALTPGFHQFALRYQDNLGRWSLFANRTFYITLGISGTLAAQLKRAEYFFDNDPGTGLGKPLPITANATENNSFSIDISALTSGFHQLAIRYEDNTGHWALFANRTFYIVPVLSATAATSLKRAEYFFDNDPGLGLAKPLTITAGNPENNTFNIDISALTPGFHQLAIRYQDNKSRWSQFANRTFYVVPSPSAAIATSITKVEYFFDHDPGAGLGKTLAITPGSTQTTLPPIDISSLSPGFHQLAIRYKDNLHRWSTFALRTFYVIPGTVVTKTVERIEYFFDTNDPGFGSAKALSFTPAAVINQPFTIDVSAEATGNHTLNVRTRDSQGYWSTIVATNFSIVNCTPPSAPVVPAVSRCNSGSVNLVASGASGSQIYQWYASTTSTPKIFTGATYSTPTLNLDTSYYVTVYDPSTSCESGRTKASATIVNIPKPAISPSGSLTVCAGNSVQLSAPAGFVSYAWSNGLTGPQSSITASTTGSYTVTVSDGTCTSPPSDPFNFTVNALPPKPSINATGGGTLCGNGSITLSATVGYPTYSWSSGQNVQSFAVNSPGQFYVTVTDANGCQSTPSDVFSVTSNAPAKPIIVVTGSTSLCNSSTVQLAAPPGFAHYAWSSGDTIQTIITSTAVAYTVTVSNGSCASPQSDPVNVVQIPVPSAPTIQAKGDTVLCENSFVGLAAPSGYSYYKWSDNETLSEILVSTAGPYTVQVGNAPNCLSQPSPTVYVSLSGKPCTNSGGNTSNTPPTIGQATIYGAVGNIITFDLKPLIAKGTIGIDFSTLRVPSALPESGAKASIDANYDLVLDYTGNTFVGKEYADVQVCDSLNSCTERALEIIITADIEVFNAVSPFPDGLNDFFNLKYIDKIDDTKNNNVVIVDRWGNEVFSIANYNNQDRVFKGLDNGGRELPSGTYYYRVDFPSGRETLTGFLSLKR